MADSSLANKLKLKPGQRAALINAPQGYMEELGPQPAGIEWMDRLEGKFDWIQIFVKNKAELERWAPAAINALKADAPLWISFPKGTSKIQTDLTRDKGWESLQQSELKAITLVSVNAAWSAFAMRLYRPGEARQSFR
jgi:hypothetical protein